MSLAASCTSLFQRRGLVHLSKHQALFRPATSKVRGARGTAAACPAAPPAHRHALHSSWRPLSPIPSAQAARSAAPPAPRRQGVAAMASSAAAPQAAAPPAAAPATDPKLVRIRAAMARADGGRGIQAFIVPSEDPHMASCVGGGRHRAAQHAACSRQRVISPCCPPPLLP